MVAVIAIGKGGEEEVKAQFSGLSAETIYINPDYSSGANVFEGNFKKITPEHMDFIMNESTTLKGIYLRGSAYKEAVINSIKEIEIKDDIDIVLKDGNIECIVEKIINKEV